MMSSLNELGSRGLVVDLNMPLELAHSLASQCKGTKFVVEHLGGAPVTDMSKFAVWEASAPRFPRFRVPRFVPFPRRMRPYRFIRTMRRVPFRLVASIEWL
jgi:hypothetical protein